MIAIVNYGSGNVQAIANVYRKTNIPFTVAETPDGLRAASRIVLPGVGAFDQAMGELERSGMRGALDEAVREQHKPVLGICVGMQLLARGSEEGRLSGLGWIDGFVRRFDHAAFEQRTHLPHMGWNTVEPRRSDALFDGIDLATGYYFLHSYYFAAESAQDVLATTTYGREFASAVQHHKVYGVQFHPEKSHEAGVRLLTNFAAID